jgi:F0F1-type ATP synthase assembly protein I
MSTEQRSPEEIREDIGETREELGDTVEALAGKADVKAQAKAKVDSAKQGAQEKVASARETAQAKAKENPVPVAIAAAFVAGVLVAWIVKR